MDGVEILTCFIMCYREVTHLGTFSSSELVEEALFPNYSIEDIELTYTAVVIEIFKDQ